MKQRIVYEDIPVESGTFVVDELSAVELAHPHVIKQLLGVIMDAYIPQYAPHTMTEDDIRSRYSPEDWSNVWRFWKHSLRHYFRADSQFFVGRSTAKPGEFLSFAKMSDGPKSDQNAVPGSRYFNDIVVRPPWGNGLGAATVHAAFTYGGHANEPVLLEGFEGSSVNAWYTDRWGLVPGELSQPFQVSGAQERYFYSPEGHTLGDIALNLEFHNPALRSAQ